MKIKKFTFIMIILNLLITPLLGNETLLDILHINIIATILFYTLPITLAISISIDWLKSDKKYKKIDIPKILFIIFTIILTLSLIFAVVIRIYTFSNYIKLILILYLLIILSMVKFTDKQKKIIDYGIIILLIITSIYGILQYIFKFQTTLAGIEKYPGATGRVKSTFYIATIFDKYLLISLFYSLILLIENRINKILVISAFLIGNLALIFTFCRTSLIIILFIYFTLFIYCIVRKKTWISILIILVIIGSYFIPGQKYLYSSTASYFQDIVEKINFKPLEKITNPIFNLFILEVDEDADIQLVEDKDFSLESRKDYRGIAFNIMLSNPTLGTGIGSYTYIYDEQKAYKYIDRTKYDIPLSEYQYPHCMYAQLGAEIGIIGTIIFFILIIYMLVKRKTIYSLLMLLIVLLSCYTESIFYMKDVAYFTAFIMAFISNNNFIKKNIDK